MMPPVDGFLSGVPMCPVTVLSSLCRLRPLFRLAVWFALVSVALAPVPGRADTQKIPKVVGIYGCVQCHTLDGKIVAPGIPRLAGQRMTYLSRQLNHFTLGEVVYDGEVVSARRQEVMNDLAGRLNTAQLRSIARFYSGKACNTNAGADPVPPDGVERCEVCHGGQRANPWRDTPTLNAQDATYLKRTIHMLWEARQGYKAGARRHHRMAEVMFVDADEPNLDAYAEYYAALPCGKK